MVFPLFKLGTLLIKSATKPISRSLQSYAKTNPRFSKTCYKIAKSYHNTYNYFAKPLRLPYKINKPSREQSVDLGASIVSEGLVVSVATGVLYYEYHKKSQQAFQDQRIENTIEILERKLEFQQEKFKRLEDSILYDMMTDSQRQQYLSKFIQHQPTGHFNISNNF